MDFDVATYHSVISKQCMNMLVLALHNSSLEINCDLFIFLVLQLKIYKFHGEFFMQTLKKELPRLHVPIVSKKNMQRAAKQL